LRLHAVHSFTEISLASRRLPFAFSLPFVYDATRPALHLSNGDVTTLSLDRSRAAAPLPVTISRGQRALCREPFTAKGLSIAGRRAEHQSSKS
jgi:hypothetical protein